MRIDKHIAPSFAQFQPFPDRVIETGWRPVYPDLAGDLANAKEHPDETVAHVLATCSGYVYSTVDNVAIMMTRMGLAGSHCLMVQQRVDSLLINATAALVQSPDGRAVILGYRGTEPLDLLTWLTDLDVSVVSVPFHLGAHSDHFDVHGGFYRNTRAVEWPIVSALARALAGRSILDDGDSMEFPMEPLYVTGHSLGGAMALIMALMLRTEPAYAEIADKLRGVYTFGQPMIGCRRLADQAGAVEFFAERLIRYVYRRDVAPHIPSWGFGDFAHFGQEYVYNGRWLRAEAPSRPMVLLSGMLVAAGDFVARQHRLLRRLPFRYSFSDHLPRNYITALTPPDRSLGETP